MLEKVPFFVVELVVVVDFVVDGFGVDGLLVVLDDLLLVFGELLHCVDFDCFH
jgi:hypothetical protein